MPQWRKHPDFPNYEISDEARVVGFKDGNNLNCAADNLYMTDKVVA